MSDDDLIRDAVHELVAAAPTPGPLPSGDASHGRSYRWVAIAAATILVVGGVAAVAWINAGDDEAEPVATTVTEPVPSAPTSSPAVIPPQSTNPGTVVSPETSSPPTEPSAAPTSTSPATTSTTTTAAPASPEEANVREYLSALAEGRYGDPAALVLNEGGLEPERRAGMRPLFDEYGDVDDLPARLRSWCEEIAVCTQPDGPPVDIGGYWVATWTTPGGTLTSYFRSGSFEGSPSVSGLPPRRAQGSVTPCPTEGVVAVREASLDADAVPETIVLTRSPDGSLLVNVCNTSLSVPALELPPTETPVVGVLQPSSAPDATLLLGESGETGVCAATYRLAASAGAFVAIGWDGCWGLTGESIGCRDVDGEGDEEAQIVGYQYSFVGGDRLDNSTAMDVDVLSLDGALLDSFTLAMPDQIDAALQIIEPTCNGLTVVAEG